MYINQTLPVLLCFNLPKDFPFCENASYLTLKELMTINRICRNVGRKSENSFIRRGKEEQKKHKKQRDPE